MMDWFLSVTVGDTILFVLGVLDVVAAFVLMWACLRITSQFGFRSSFARWAMFRRLMYFMGMIALFTLGMGRLSGHFDATVYEAVSHIALLIIVIVFPVLRALGFISQDTWDDMGTMS